MLNTIEYKLYESSLKFVQTWCEKNDRYFSEALFNQCIIECDRDTESKVHPIAKYEVKVTVLPEYSNLNFNGEEKVMEQEV